MESPLKVLLAHSSWLPGVQIWDKNLETTRYIYCHKDNMDICHVWKMSKMHWISIGTNSQPTHSPKKLMLHLAHINFLLVALAAKHKPVTLKLNPCIGSAAVILFSYILDWFRFSQMTWLPVYLEPGRRPFQVTLWSLAGSAQSHWW